MNNAHEGPAVSGPVKLLELVVMNARDNRTSLLAMTVEIERFADRMQGSAPTPIGKGVGEAPLRPADPPMIDQLRGANDDMAEVLARLQNVVSRITSLA